MRSSIDAVVAFVLMSLTCFAGDGPKNVPEVAQHEISRRGNMVEMTGTTRSGLMAAALAPPHDDSGKWFITLVVKPGDPDSEYLKSVIAKSADMRCWVDVAEPNKSNSHYQVRSVDDKTQVDWLSGIQPLIDRYGLPCVVLQPPRSGQFGPPATIVKTIHGISSAKYLSEKLREAIVTYVKILESTLVAGVKAEDSANPIASEIGVAPPFPVPQPQRVPDEIVRPRQPTRLPFEFPPDKPKELTLEEIEDACPGASAEFVMRMYRLKETDIKIVKLEYRLEKEKAKPPCQLTPVVDEPQEPESVPLETESPSFFFEKKLDQIEKYQIISIVMLASTAVVLGWWYFLWNKSEAEKTGLLEEIFDEINQLVDVETVPTATEQQKSTPVTGFATTVK